MALILTQSLLLYGSSSRPGLTNATVQLHNDRFVIFTPGSTTVAPEIVLDTPLSGLSVTGSMSVLTFAVGAEQRRIEFDSRVSGALSAPDSGTSDAAALLEKSGINTWLKELRGQGVPVKYRLIGSIIYVLITLN
jgi:hypothetical protein